MSYYRAGGDDLLIPSDASDFILPGWMTKARAGLERLFPGWNRKESDRLAREVVEKYQREDAERSATRAHADVGIGSYVDPWGRTNKPAKVTNKRRTRRRRRR